jgi:hypothetical protein
MGLIKVEFDAVMRRTTAEAFKPAIVDAYRVVVILRM